MKKIYHKPEKELLDYLNKFYIGGIVEYKNTPIVDKIIKFKLDKKQNRIGYLVERNAYDGKGSFPGNYIMCFEQYNKEYMLIHNNEIINCATTYQQKELRRFKTNITKLRLDKLGDL